ncbi:hypothetical protein EG832_17435, partial [bacterium]|nr:hypothetical protein [bacterium]
MSQNSWKIQRSILFEMDTVFSLLNDYLPLASLSISINQLVESIPPAMVQELRALLGDNKKYFGFLLAAGFSTKTAFEEDYVQATMPIRQMSSKGYIEQILARAAEYDIQMDIDSSLSIVEQMENANSQLVRQSGRRIGYFEQSGEIQNLSLKSDTVLLARFLADGEKHDQFWHWLDRFYYQIYQPWRQKKEPVLRASEEKARMCLRASTDQLLV